MSNYRLPNLERLVRQHVNRDVLERKSMRVATDEYGNTKLVPNEEDGIVIDVEAREVKELPCS